MIEAFHTAYLTSLFDPDEYQKIVKEIASFTKEMKKFGVTCLVGRGVSGTIPLFQAAHAARVNPVIVRKPNEDSHCDTLVENLPCHKNTKYVIVDDLISSGNTMRLIKKAVEERNPNAKCVGIILWYSCQNDEESAMNEIEEIFGEGIKLKLMCPDE